MNTSFFRSLFFSFCLILGMMTDVNTLRAQEIKVKFAEALPQDLSARTNPRLDGNDEACALIKVIVPTVEGMQFEGWVIGNVGYRPGEYQVYVPAGTKKITFRHPDYAPGEIRFTFPIEGKCTYRVVLDVPQKTNGLESVEKGESASMLKMARNYEKGTGAYDKNLDEALKWYEKAAEAGSIEAQEYLADVLYVGKKGFSKDASKALRWNEKCANRGKGKAIYRTAELYKGMEKNEQAVAWYIKYNELHPDKDVQMQIAQLSPKERNKWLKIAADNGHIEAAYLLASYLAPKDAQTATIYFQKAVDGNHVKALCDYGTILMTGKYGFTKDETKGQILLNKAKERGSLEAQSTGLQTDDVQMASYVMQIPELLNSVKKGDADAIVKLFLIYRALGDSLMVEKMRVVARYNFSYPDVPIPPACNKFLLEKARVYPSEKYRDHALYAPSDEQKMFLELYASPFCYPIKFISISEYTYGKLIDVFKENCERTKFLIDNIILAENADGKLSDSKYILASASTYEVYRGHLSKCDEYGEIYVKYFYLPVLKHWSETYHDEDAYIKMIRMNGLDIKNMWEITWQPEYDYVEEVYKKKLNILENKKYGSRTEKKSIEKELIHYRYLLRNAIIHAKYTPWIRQLKEEGYLWTPEVAANATVMDEQLRKYLAEEARKKELEAIEKQHLEIRSRGKRPGVKTFIVKGVPFNMVLVKPNPKAIYGRRGADILVVNAPRSSYYIGETEVTKELWNAVMGEPIEDSNVAQQPMYIGDWNKYQEVFGTFINKLNQMTGKRFRLLSYEEWEYAAQGGALTGNPTENEETSLYRQGKLNHSFKREPYQVAQKEPNELGLYDILSGVGEFHKGKSTAYQLELGMSFYDHCFGLRLGLSVNP